MLLLDKRGIACDFCGTSYRDKFEYYSLETTEYKVINNQRFPGKNAKFNKDMCTSCYDKLIEEVLKHIKPHKRGAIKDDLSGKYGTGTFNYWFIIFAKVDVDKEMAEGNQVEVEERVLDLNLVDYQVFIDRTKAVEEKLKKTGAWS